MARQTSRTWPGRARRSAWTASRGAAAAEGADQGDAHHARHVRGREPLRRRDVHRHHHAARHRSRCAARAGSASTTARWTARTPWSPKKGPAQNRQLNANIGGIADQGQEQLLALDRRLQQLPHAEPVRGHACRHAGRNLNLRSAAPTTSRLRPVRLRAHQGPDPARGVRAVHARAARTRASARYDLAGTGLLDRRLATSTSRVQEAGPIGRRFFINTRLRADLDRSGQSTRLVEAPTIIVHRRVHRRWRAARRAARTRGASRSSRTSITCAGIHSWRIGIQLGRRPVPIRRVRPTISGPTRSRASRRTRLACRARSRGGSATRPIAYWNFQGGVLRPGRHPGPQEPHAQPGRALRGADAPARHHEHRPAVRHHVGAVQEREDHAARECAASSTTG